MHEGNDEADRLTKLSKDVCEITDPTELLKGEEAYVLGCREEVAQGSYREWVQEKVTEKYIDTSGSVGLGKVRLARGMSRLTLWASLVKSLDSTKSLHAWRFWSRLLTGSLPTNHRLSNMVNSNSDSIYSWVYQDELGSHGACRREGCGEESESTEHAMCGCKWAQERWRQLEEELTAEWELQGWGDWTAISWLSNQYEGTT